VKSLSDLTVTRLRRWIIGIGFPLAYKLLHQEREWRNPDYCGEIPLILTAVASRTT
jgi:hypothetical protein